MSKTFSFVAILAVLAACNGRSPTAPTTPSLPPGVLPAQTLSEVYTFPEAWISTNIKQPDGSFFMHIPVDCLRLEVIQINPGRGSILVDKLDASVTTRTTVCADAPNPDKGYQFVYWISDENGNDITSWLATPGNWVMPGSSGGDRANMLVIGGLPPVMPRLRVKVRTEHGFILARKTVFMDENWYLHVLVPLDWRH